MFSISADGASALLQHSDAVLAAVLQLLDQHMTEESLGSGQAAQTALQCLAGMSRSSHGAEAVLAAGAAQHVVAVMRKVGPGSSSCMRYTPAWLVYPLTAICTQPQPATPQQASSRHVRRGLVTQLAHSALTCAFLQIQQHTMQRWQLPQHHQQ